MQLELPLKESGQCLIQLASLKRKSSTPSGVFLKLIRTALGWSITTTKSEGAVIGLVDSLAAF